MVDRPGWLAEPSEAAVGAALDRLVPGLGDTPLRLNGNGHDQRPEWRRDTAFVGDDLVVKFAWSEPAAAKLRHECRVMGALSGAGLAVPVVERTSSDPVLLLTRRLPGGPIWPHHFLAMGGTELRRAAAEIAGVLATLHRPTTLAAVAAATPLGPPVPQATTAALRNRLGAFVDEARTAKVRAWCDWVDDVLAAPSTEVFLHGDFAGHNWLWDHTAGTLVAVVDLEESCAGDHHYDFRYLPTQVGTLDLLHEVVGAYERAAGRTVDLERVMAWHVRTSLGDTLWRSEAGVSLPSGGSAPGMVDEVERNLALLGIDPTS